MKLSATSAFSVKRSALSVLCLSGLWLLSTGLCPAATPLPNAKISGTSEVSSGTFTIKPGATLDVTGATIIGLPTTSAKLTSLSGLAGGANKFPVFTGTDTFGQIDLPAYAQSVLALGTSAEWRASILPASPAAGHMVYYNGTSWVSQLMPTGIPKIASGGAMSASIAGTDYVSPGSIIDSGLTTPGVGLLGRVSSGGGAIERLALAEGFLNNGTNLYATGFFRSRAEKSGAYTVVALDRGVLIDCTGSSFSVALTAAATLGDGFLVGIFNSGAGTITVDPATTETILDPAGSATTKSLSPGESMALLCNGTSWLVVMQAKAATAGFTNPMTTAGDIITTGSGGTPARLAMGTAGQMLRVNAGGTALEYATAGGGSGDVVGPASSTNNRLAIYSGTTGKLLQDSTTLTASTATITTTTTNGDVNINPAGTGFTVINPRLAIEGLAGGAHGLYLRGNVGASGKIYIAGDTGDLARGANIGARIGFMDNSAYGNHIIFETKQTGGSGTTTVEAMRITAGASNSGNLLIGTTSSTGLTGAGGLIVGSTTASTSTSTGAAIVKGGLAVAGRVSSATSNVGGTNGTTIDLIASASATLDFASIAAASSADITITVTGASTGDVVSLGLPDSPAAGIIFQAFVSAANTVTVRAHNYTASAVDPASASYRVKVTSF